MGAPLHSYSGTQFPPKLVMWGQYGMGRETMKVRGGQDSVARTGNDEPHFFPGYMSGPV